MEGKKDRRQRNQTAFKSQKTALPDSHSQWVLDRLDSHRAHRVEAVWTHGKGTLKVLTPDGTVLARVDAVDDADVAVHPVVVNTCHALQSGDAARIGQLFGQMLKAA